MCARPGNRLFSKLRNRLCAKNLLYIYRSANKFPDQQWAVLIALGSSGQQSFSAAKKIRSIDYSLAHLCALYRLSKLSMNNGTQAASKQLTYRDVKHLRQVCSDLVVRSRDHAVNHVHVYCPFLHWHVSNIWRPVGLPPAGGSTHQRS